MEHLIVEIDSIISNSNNKINDKIIKINLDLGIGDFKRTVYASDLTYEYVRINADYRS